MQKSFLTRVIFFSSVLLLLFTLKGFSQVAANIEFPKAAPGTYQLQTTNPKAQELFTEDLLVRIEANRDQLVEKIILVGTYTSVRILPYAVIDAPGFIPLPDEVLVIE